MLSYFAAYWFKVGEYLAYDISPRLIRIELIDSLRAGGYLGIALALVLLCYQVVLGARELVADAGRLIRAALISGTILAAFYALGWALLGMKVEETTSLLMTGALYLGYVIVAAVIIFIAMYLYVGRRDGFRVVTDRVITRSKSSEMYREMLNEALRAKVTVTLVAASILAFFVYLYGFTSARRQTSFEQIQDTPYVVIDTFNDRLLCKSVNEKRDGLLPGFTLVPMKEGEAMSFVSLKLSKKDESASPSAVPEPSKPQPAAPGAAEPTRVDAAAAAPSPSTTAPAR
ncbi:MAG: hypothetical protein V4662_26970 [Verrucomicrobiota bacterium]